MMERTVVEVVVVVVLVVVVVVVVVVVIGSAAYNTIEEYAGANRPIFQKPVPCRYVGLVCHRL